MVFQKESSMSTMMSNNKNINDCISKFIIELAFNEMRTDWLTSNLPNIKIEGVDHAYVEQLVNKFLNVFGSVLKILSLEEEDNIHRVIRSLWCGDYMTQSLVNAITKKSQRKEVKFDIRKHYRKVFAQLKKTVKATALASRKVRALKAQLKKVFVQLKKTVKANALASRAQKEEMRSHLVKIQ